MPDRLTPIELAQNRIMPYVKPHETLLCKPDRLPRKPKLGERSGLYVLIRDRLDDYLTMLGAICMGTTYCVAAEMIGISQWQFNSWMTIGKEAIRVGNDGEYQMVKIRDSYESRFFLDVKKAAAIARGEAEMKIYVKEPMAYVRIGPGRSFGDEWRDDPNPSKRVDVVHQQERVSGQKLLGIVEEEETEDDGYIEGEFDKAPVSADSMAEALMELDKAGIISITEEGKKAISSQYSIEDRSNKDETILTVEEAIQSDKESEEGSNAGTIKEGT